MDYKTTQKHIFDYLLIATGKCQAVLVEEICKLFSCSKSSVYKRWRGDQPLIHPDIALLKQQYDIPTEVVFPDGEIPHPINKTIYLNFIKKATLKNEFECRFLSKAMIYTVSIRNPLNIWNNAFKQTYLLVAM